jgi:hypothetical protein
MAGEELDIAQAASRAMNVPGRDRNEAAPAGMGRATLEPQFSEEHGEPIDDAIGLHVVAARRPDDWANRFGFARDGRASGPKGSSIGFAPAFQTSTTISFGKPD